MEDETATVMVESLIIFWLFLAAISWFIYWLTLYAEVRKFHM